MHAQPSMLVRAPRALVRTTALLCGVIVATGSAVTLLQGASEDDELPFTVVADAASTGTSPAPSGFKRVDGGAAGFAISVPAGWELDDAGFYGPLADEGAGGGQDIVMVASDPGTAGSTHASLARLPDGATLEAEGFAQSVQAALEANGAMAVSVEPIALPAGAAVRSHSSLPVAASSPAVLDCTQYYVASPGGVWMLSLFSGDPGTDAPLLDQIAASLALG